MDVKQVKSKKMRLLYTLSFAAVASLTFSSCNNTANLTASKEWDDAYYSSADAQTDLAAQKLKKEQDRKKR